SEGYLQELYVEANGLEHLFFAEKAKSHGIVNGIDIAVWDPELDEFILENFNASTVVSGKKKNKSALCEAYDLDENVPLLAFTGRFALEKGADLLPGVIQQLLTTYKGKLNVIVLGCGDPDIQGAIQKLSQQYQKQLAVIFGYKEKLSHQIYASADFLIMPSRVEPCGLNQFYAMRYGTIPIVRAIGGLKDTVIDLTKKNANGILFDEVTLRNMVQAVKRGLKLYEDSDLFNKLQRENMKLDYSWKSSTRKYIQLYENLINRL